MGPWSVAEIRRVLTIATGVGPMDPTISVDNETLDAEEYAGVGTTGLRLSVRRGSRG